MSKDTKQLLHDAAPEPSSTPDFDELWREGRRQRRTGQAAGVLTALAAVGLAVLMVLTVLPASPSGVEVAGQPPTSQPTETADVEVLGKLPGAPLSIGHVAAAWTDTPQGAAALWSEFRLAGSPPELDGRALILAATGESGSCPSELEAVEVDDGRLFLQIVDRPSMSPAAVDSGCTSDFNPITFVLRTDASVLSPPFIVDFGQTSVRVDTPGVVAFADSGQRAADQRVQLREDEFEVLAAAATKYPSLKGHVFRDVDGAAALWQMADVQGSAPTLPDGTVGVFVIAREAESTCRSPEDVVGVEIVDRVAVVVLDPDGQFVQPCPGPSGAGAFTAFVVAIPARYDDLTGALSRLGEPVAGPSESEAATVSPSAVEPTPVATATVSEEPDAQPEPSTDPEPDHGASLWGRTFTSVSVSEDGQPRPLLPGTRITVTFERRDSDPSVARWNAGCNDIGGTVEVTADRLLIDDPASTTAFCSDDHEEQDNWVTEFFVSNPTWTIDGPMLTLATDRVTIQFEETTE